MIASLRRAAGTGGRREPPALFLAAVILLAAPLAAHDVWIEPSSFRPAVGERIAVRLRVGEEWRGEPVPRNPARLVRFVASGPAGETAIPGADGVDPAGWVTPAAPGLQVLGYRGNNAFLELPAEKFEAHLRHEGLERFIAERARLGESAAPSRELYSRSIKSLLAVGGSSAGGPDRRLGFTLELVAEADPFASRPGVTLPVRVLLEDAPLVGVQVVAVARADPARRVVLRSDAEGRVRLPLAVAGPWLVKAVHMRRAPAGAERDAQWESLWASLTFELPAR